jgi:hypothetical protein
MPPVMDEKLKKKREDYLSTLFMNNIGSTTGMLQQKGFLPADFIAASHKFPQMRPSQ